MPTIIEKQNGAHLKAIHIHQQIVQMELLRMSFKIFTQYSPTAKKVQHEVKYKQWLTLQQDEQPRLILTPAPGVLLSLGRSSGPNTTWCQRKAWTQTGMVALACTLRRWKCNVYRLLLLIHTTYFLSSLSLRFVHVHSTTAQYCTSNKSTTSFPHSFVKKHKTRPTLFRWQEE